MSIIPVVSKVVLVAMTITSVLLIFTHYHIAVTLSASQILYLFSTISQVVAATFGCVIVGYAFVDNEIRREMSVTQSLEAVGNNILEYSFGILVNVSVVSMFALAVSTTCISFAESSEGFFLTLILNLGVVLFFYQLFCVMKFFYHAYTPTRVAYMSEYLSQDSKDRKGDLKVFLSNYASVINDLNDIHDRIDFSTDFEKARLTPLTIAKKLFNYGLINEEVFDQVASLIYHQNVVSHMASPFIDKQTEEDSTKTRDRVSTEKEFAMETLDGDVIVNEE